MGPHTADQSALRQQRQAGLYEVGAGLGYSEFWDGQGGRTRVEFEYFPWHNCMYMNGMWFCLFFTTYLTTV